VIYSDAIPTKKMSDYISRTRVSKKCCAC